MKKRARGLPAESIIAAGCLNRAKKMKSTPALMTLRFAEAIMQQVCQERIARMHAYSSRLEFYTEMVRRALTLMDLGIESELEIVRQYWRAAWATAEQARIALRQHELDHNCGFPAARPR
jgi:hypothetical protein